MDARWKLAWCSSFWLSDIIPIPSVIEHEDKSLSPSVCWRAALGLCPKLGLETWKTQSEVSEGNPTQFPRFIVITMYCVHWVRSWIIRAVKHPLSVRNSPNWNPQNSSQTFMWECGYSFCRISALIPTKETKEQQLCHWVHWAWDSTLWILCPFWEESLSFHPAMSWFCPSSSVKRLLYCFIGSFVFSYLVYHQSSFLLSICSLVL